MVNLSAVNAYAASDHIDEEYIYNDVGYDGALLRRWFTLTHVVLHEITHVLQKYSVDESDAIAGRYYNCHDLSVVGAPQPGDVNRIILEIGHHAFWRMFCSSDPEYFNTFRRDCTMASPVLADDVPLSDGNMAYSFDQFGHTNRLTIVATS